VSTTTDLTGFLFMGFEKGKGNVRYSHGMRWTKEYSIWLSMKDRCLNSNSRDYNNYGGRGITICNEWSNNFTAFYSDMGLKPKGMSIDRVDNNKGYSKENCRWANVITQNRNQRIRKDNKSGCRGVSYCNSWKVWKASINVNKKRINLGSFKDKEEAVKAREEAELKYW